MINLRKAKIEESKTILRFYQDVIDSIKGTEFKPKWSEHYPNLEFIETSIEKQEMHVYSKDGKIIAGVLLNNRFNPEYDNINWICDAKPQEITVIHTFAVTSDYTGKGIGKEIFNQIKNNAIENNQTTIRLDIIEGNIGAQKVFEKFGFEYIDTVEMFHKAVGLEKFHLYEYVLKK
jgi:RimJ/RimL family protein N-acetyltransferase